MKIPEFIEKLKKEIGQTKIECDKAGQLLRLKNILQVYEGEDKIISFDEIAERIKNQPEQVKMMSGWSGLDSILSGFRLQQLVVVSALTKSGKTSWLMDLTARLKEFNPIWFPFEESAEELISKFLERNEEPPHAYTPAYMKGQTIQWIEERIVEAIAKFNCKMIVIDQLDFIVPFNTDNHALRVGQAMRDLKAIAKKWNVLIFIICHLVKTKMNEQPTLEDLKGSSSIGQEADTVILLWREMKKEKGQVVITNNVNISVQANRRTGRTGNVKMVYNNDKFLEQEWKSERENEAEQETTFNQF